MAMRSATEWHDSLLFGDERIWGRCNPSNFDPTSEQVKELILRVQADVAAECARICGGLRHAGMTAGDCEVSLRNLAMELER